MGRERLNHSLPPEKEVLVLLAEGLQPAIGIGRAGQFWGGREIQGMPRREEDVLALVVFLERPEARSLSVPVAAHRAVERVVQVDVQLGRGDHPVAATFGHHIRRSVEAVEQELSERRMLALPARPASFPDRFPGQHVQRQLIVRR